MDELQRQKDDATAWLKSLVGVFDSSATDIIEGMESIATICPDHIGHTSQNIRHKLKGLIPTIVKRIEVLLFKRANRNVIAKEKNSAMQLTRAISHYSEDDGMEKPQAHRLL